MPGGVARSFVTASKSGDVMEMGVAISEKVMAALAKDAGETPWEKVLKLPSQVNLAPFQHIGIDWNPHGHEPEPIYGPAHFDFHFYQISSEERMMIPFNPAVPDSEKPAPQYLPAGYSFGGVQVPMMGVHWVDFSSPEFNGNLFTHTFIYGSYMSKVIFYEPMITLDYLTSKPDVTVPIKQPAAFAKPGSYPANYQIRYDSQSKDYIVSLSGFSKKMGDVSGN
jgi:hypothetical protein